MRPWNFSPETWKSDWKPHSQSLGEVGSHGKAIWLAGAATRHPRCVLQIGQAARLLKSWACEFFTPVFELSMGRPATQAGVKEHWNLEGCLAGGAETCVFLLISSWPAGLKQAFLIKRKHPCLERRQFSATLSLLHAEGEGRGRPGWWRITQKDVQHVLAGLASPETLRWSEHSKTELGLGECMTQESRHGLGGRNYREELTSGDMGCLCQLAGNAFKCHLCCYLNLNDMLIKG